MSTMPRKAFLADLSDAQSRSIPNITAVEAGPTSGTFSFLYVSHHLPDDSVIIQGEVPEVSDYPAEHDCFLFIGSDHQNPPPTIPTTLASLSSQVKGKTLLETLVKVATALDNALDPTAPVEISDDEQLEDGEIDYDVDDYDDDDIYSGKPHTAAAVRTTAMKSPAEAITAQRIRSDLRAVKRAGFKVGILGNLEGTGIVCVSIRITKLGISEEAMKAWGLRRKQYLILMIRFLDGYQTIEQVQNEPTLSNRTQIRLGLCESYKPTFDDATNLFTRAPASASSKCATSKPPQINPKEAAAKDTLDPLFIDSPLNGLFRERFAAILKYRLACAYPWGGAELFFHDVQGKNFNDVDTADPRYLAHEDMKGRTLPQIVTADTIEETISGIALSLPLVAMQFLLRHFVRCTEFCLVCHCRVDGTFEALKPYVCSRPLCLYQYMSLGFGPSIGWEIITQPYVVDVLTSFCYISARNGKLKDFPTGIAMRVPMLPQVGAPAQADQYSYHGVLPVDTKSSLPDAKHTYEKSFSARLDRANSELLIIALQQNPVRAGDWLAVQSTANHNVYHYRVADASLCPTVRLEGDGVFLANHKAPPKSGSATTTQIESVEVEGGFFDVDVWVYDQDFDVLSDIQKRNCVVMLLDTLPPILSLREHLLSSGADSQLRRHDVSESALNLLRWIIASNRSCIMQVDKLADKHAGSKPLKHFSDTGSEERCSGMDEYMQFRFAQGAPDKEQRFITCVNEVAERTKSTRHPTIFAWHGSPIGNWHGILREGLHFKDTMHGRAYGHGVYMSNSVHTSLGYSAMGGYGGSGGAPNWPNSDLKISSAISLNEVVNCPGEFVSSTPHYVVNQLDWIQTRYLFVKTGKPCHTTTSAPIVSYQQDPARPAMGAGNTAVVIPITAVSKSRRPVVDTKTLQNGTKKAKVIGTVSQQTAEDAQDDADSVVSDIADREYLDSDMEDEVVAPIVLKEISNGRVKRPRNAVDMASSKVADLSLTNFVPGSLDLSSLKMLKEPAYATPAATKRLAKTLQELVKVQKSTPLHELGWYIDADKVENMFQWIVELHSFEKSLPLATDMKKAGLTSIVLEMRFTADYPFSPPFIRVVRPRFLPFLAGGGGHVTAGGAICMELLTNNGWLVTNSIESVLLQIRMAISSTEPKPARLEGLGGRYGVGGGSYGVGEAIEAYKRACRTHGWEIPKDIDTLQKE